VLGGLHKGGKGRECGNCVLTVDCVRGDGIKGGKGRKGVGNCVLTADCVRGIG